MLDSILMGVRVVSNGKQAKNSKWKYMPLSEIEPAIPRFPALLLLLRGFPEY